MREYLSTTFLIVDVKKYHHDIVFIGISPYEGQRYVIVKGGASGVSKRARAIDIGNIIKAKLYQRNHWYLSESEPVESLNTIRSNLQLLVLYQALLAVLKIAYVLPEKKIFYAIYSTLKLLRDVSPPQKQELALFLLLMRVLAHYELATFPFYCETCKQRMYEGYINWKSSTYSCNEHRKEGETHFSIKTTGKRLEFTQQLLKRLLNINFAYTPVINDTQDKTEKTDQSGNDVPPSA